MNPGRSRDRRDNQAPQLTIHLRLAPSRTARHLHGFAFLPTVSARSSAMVRAAASCTSSAKFGAPASARLVVFPRGRLTALLLVFTDRVVQNRQEGRRMIRFAFREGRLVFPD